MSAPPANRTSWLQRHPLLGPVIGLVFVLVLFEVMVAVHRARSDLPLGQEGLGAALGHLWHNRGDFWERYNFLTPYTIGLFLKQMVIVGTGALGMTLIIVTGGIDLSAGSVVALTSVLAALVMHAGVLPGWAIAALTVLYALGCGWLLFKTRAALTPAKNAGLGALMLAVAVALGCGLGASSSFAAVVVAVVAGGFFGAINGGVIAGFRMLPFIVTLGMMGAARGMAKLFADNKNVNFDMGTTEGVNALMNNPHSLAPGDAPGPVLSMLSLFFAEDPRHAGALLMPEWLPPPGVLILLVLTVVMSFVLNRTVYGRHIFALGSNEDTARLCGLNTRWLKASVYAVGGLFIGLAGALQLARLRQGDPTVATGLELDIIAAVVIGGASLSGGVGSIWGAVIGALMMSALRTGTTSMGWSSASQEIIIGVVIVLAHGLDKIRQRGLKG